MERALAPEGCPLSATRVHTACTRRSHTRPEQGMRSPHSKRPICGQDNELSLWRMAGFLERRLLVKCKANQCSSHDVVHPWSVSVINLDKHSLVSHAGTSGSYRGGWHPRNCNVPVDSILAAKQESPLDTAHTCLEWLPDPCVWGEGRLWDVSLKDSRQTQLRVRPRSSQWPVA